MVRLGGKMVNVVFECPQKSILFPSPTFFDLYMRKAQQNKCIFRKIPANYWANYGHVNVYFVILSCRPLYCVALLTPENRHNVASLLPPSFIVKR